MSTEPVVSPEDQAKMQQVAASGAQAAGEAPPGEQAAAAKKAMKNKAGEVKLDIPDEQLDAVADALAGKLADIFDERGAFQPPPEPVRPPEQAQQAPPPPGEPAQPPESVGPASPRKPTFAERWMGS